MALESLKEYNHWVLWDYEEGQKVPYSSKEKKASVTAKSTWTSWENVRDSEFGQGIGFVFSKDDPFFGVDIDDCIDGEGNFSEMARFIMDSMEGCYVEYSPSGTGLHILGKGHLPAWASKNNQTNHLEVYDKARYFTVTFDQLEGSGEDAVDAQDGLNKICLKYMMKNQDKQRPKGSDEGVPCYEEGERDDKLFGLARSLFHRGNPKWLAVEGVKQAAKNCKPPMEDPEKVAREKVNSAWKCGDPHPETVMREMNELYCLVGGKTIIEKGIEGVYFHDLTSLKTMFLPEKMKVELEDGKVKQMTKAEFWLGHPDRRAAKTVVCKPTSKVEGHEFNVWRGLNYEPKKNNWDLYEQHIRENVANGEDEIYEWIMDWMASIVQDPEHGPSTCLVLRGGQGIGKGMVANHFKALFGSHAIAVSQPAHFVGRFNAHMTDKVLVFADEAIWGGDKRAEGELKHMITDEYRTIEPKGHDQFEVGNCVHLIMASNENWVVPAGLDDRRFMVVDIKHKASSQFFSDLQRQMENKGREGLLYHLLYERKPKDPRMPIIQTQAQQEQKEYSMNSVLKAWVDWLDLGYINRDDGDWPQIITRKELYNAYLETVSNYGFGYKVLNKHFWEETKERILPWVKERIKGFQFDGATPFQDWDRDYVENLQEEYGRKYRPLVNAGNKSYVILPSLEEIKDKIQKDLNIEI